MEQALDIGKAHQRLIREEKSDVRFFGELFPCKYPESDIKKAELDEVSYQDAKGVILEYEWLGTMGTTQRHYGIFYDGYLAGVVCFGYFQAMNTNKGGHPYAPLIGEKYAKKGIQLTRGACCHWAHPHSGSKLIAYGLKRVEKDGYKYCIAFSDPLAGEIGTLYQATNWYYLGFGKTKHYDVYTKDGKIWMNDRDFYKKYKFCGRKKMEKFVEDKPNLFVKERLPKARYIKLLGSKKEKKEMYSVLEPLIKPYPKRRM